MSLLIPRDFNLVVNETTNLYGKLETTTSGGIEVKRGEFKAGGDHFTRRPITGFDFKPFKFKILSYPNGLDALPIGEDITLSWTQYLVDEDNGEEHGIRHFYKGQLDTPTESDNKRDDLVSWDYEVTDMQTYRKFKDDKLIDEGDRKKKSLILNGKTVWGNRNRILQLGNS